MKTASMAEVKANLSTLLEDSANEPIVVTRNGKPVGVLLAMSDEDELERFRMAHSPRLQQMLNAARKRIKAGQGIPEEQFWKEVEADSQKHRKRRKTA